MTIAGDAVDFQVSVDLQVGIHLFAGDDVDLQVTIAWCVSIAGVDCR